MTPWRKRLYPPPPPQLSSHVHCLAGEYELWLSLVKWITAPSHPERQGNTLERNLCLLLPLIRFPLMTPDELTLVERCPLVEKCPKIFNPQLLLAYKFNSLPLSTRAGAKEFSGSQFLLRWGYCWNISCMFYSTQPTEATRTAVACCQSFPRMFWGGAKALKKGEPCHSPPLITSS